MKYFFKKRHVLNFREKFSNQEISLAAFLLGQVIFKGFLLGPLLLLLHVNDMPQAVKCDLFLYPDDTCLAFQHENVQEIENQLYLNFSSLNSLWR